MKSVSYSSTQFLSCAPCSGEIIICIDNALTVSGKPYIEGQVGSSQSYVSQLGQYVYTYGFLYEENQLINPAADLIEGDINGVFCKGCLVDYIDSNLGQVVCPTEELNSGTIVVCKDGVSGLLTGLEGQVPFITNEATGEVQFADLPSPSPIGSRIVFTIGDGAEVITPGIKKSIEVTQNSTITGWKGLSDDAATTAGDIVFDIWKDVYANYPPTVADTIIDTGSGGVKPNITATNITGISANVNNWITALTAGDILRFNVDSVNSLTSVTLILEVTIP